MQTWYAVYESRVRNWAGVDLNMKRGMIGGKKIINKVNALPPYYRFNFAEKQTYFSAYHISKHTIKNYVKGLIENKVEYMVGYAFSNFQLANLIIENKIKAPKSDVVFLVETIRYKLVRVELGGHSNQAKNIIVEFSGKEDEATDGFG